MTLLPGGATILYRNLSLGPGNTIRRASTAFLEDGVKTIHHPKETLRRDHGHNRDLLLRSQIFPVPPDHTAGHSHNTFRASPPPFHISELSRHVTTRR